MTKHRCYTHRTLEIPPCNSWSGLAMWCSTHSVKDCPVRYIPRQSLPKSPEEGLAYEWEELVVWYKTCSQMPKTGQSGKPSQLPCLCMCIPLWKPVPVKGPMNEWCISMVGLLTSSSPRIWVVREHSLSLLLRWWCQVQNNIHFRNSHVSVLIPENKCLFIHT